MRSLFPSFDGRRHEPATEEALFRERENTGLLKLSGGRRAGDHTAPYAGSEVEFFFNNQPQTQSPNYADVPPAVHVRPRRPLGAN